MRSDIAKRVGDMFRELASISTAERELLAHRIWRIVVDGALDPRSLEADDVLESFGLLRRYDDRVEYGPIQRGQRWPGQFTGSFGW